MPAAQLWSQDNFSKGELSPYMYARAQVQQYYDGLKTATNVLNYPTGAAGKRFGTLFNSILSLITATNQFYFQTFQYLDVCIFQLVFTPMAVSIYLEGLLVDVKMTTFDAQQIQSFSTTTLGAAFRIAGNGFHPADLVLSLNAPIALSGVSGNEFTIGISGWQTGIVLPVQFTTTTSLPTTNPQVKLGLTYFIWTSSNSTASLYSSATDAKAQINPITLSSAGTGANIVVLNTWTVEASYFKNLPIYDFNGPVASYDNITFTPSATTGSAVTITLSSAYAPLTSAYVGGAFVGAGGTSRITAVASTTAFTVAVQEPFDSTSPIQGSLTLLAEPAWSDLRGWPQVCSSYQNRALFANTVSLPNGFWASVINSYPNFGNLTTDDDDAIAWFPSSNDVNVIRFIVPFRSITVHTNSGIYSSPLSEIAAITPNTFTLQLQDSTPADVLAPQAIDNQIIILSGNDCHTMLWDGINNAYTSNIVSIVNEQTIRNPVDETAYADLKRAGSRYVFIVNESGSMAVYQTLLAEQVSGFTPQIMEQSYGAAQFRQVASSSNGRAWFVVERQQATAGSAIAITGFTADTLTAIASNFDQDEPTAVTFTTTGSLPAASPALAIDTYYWAIGTGADTFLLYLDQADAIAGVNSITFTSDGTNSHVIGWPLATIFTLEELTHDTYLDCAVHYDSTPTDVISTGGLFNAQQVKMVGDGFGFDAQGINNQVAFTAHGNPIEVSEAYIGFKIKTIMQPMPLSTPQGANTSLTKPTHIRTVRFMFNQTIGGTINGVPIVLKDFDEVQIGEPPLPARGVFEMSIMQGWDDSDPPTFTLEHDDPFNIELIGIFYTADT